MALSPPTAVFPLLKNFFHHWHSWGERACVRKHLARDIGKFVVEQLAMSVCLALQSHRKLKRLVWQSHSKLKRLVWQSHSKQALELVHALCGDMCV